MSVRILAAGGGTSGHVYPAIAIADRICKDAPGSVVEFCGTAKGIESELIPDAGYRMHVIRASGFPSKPSPKIVRALSDYIAGRKACIDIIRMFKPDAIVGTGGYVCSPLVSAAAHMKVPVILHEQNAYPGRSNRLLSRKAAVVCTGFPGMEHYFKSAGRVDYTGNPIREVFRNTNKAESRAILGFMPEEFVVLAMGGSLGSRTINRAVVGLGEHINDNHIRIILSAGKQQFRELKEEMADKENMVEVFEYIRDTHIYMSAADLIVCRAGAITCAEVAAVGVPSIMIPYPYAAGDHQNYNARAFSEAKAGITIKDDEVTAERLAAEIKGFSSRRDYAEIMGNNAKRLHYKASDEKIAQIVLNVC
ncbi:MAG: undecaprenyldiphospho-muramoylpentapeptide beta-N-acetylglucosaminyltransferase [Clostridiales bacterium]|nr:undecaprenyldiphospho-muramoylpentapeptide beta-N-acetylglucosaminyltransferase [Clostridiales bacterium]